MTPVRFEDPKHDEGLYLDLPSIMAVFAYSDAETVGTGTIPGTRVALYRGNVFLVRGTVREALAAIRRATREDAMGLGAGDDGEGD